MTTETLGLPERLIAYIRREMVRESAACRGLREISDRHPDRQMRMSPEQGQVMAFLVRLTRARRIVEIGTFVGYSALWMAEALPSDGRIVTCDVEPAYPEIGRPFWRQAGVEDRIDLRIGPALETIAALLQNDGQGSFDFAFIDADKRAYPEYVRGCLELLRPGGLLLIDNVFWNGDVADPANHDKQTEAIRAATRLVMGDRSLVAATVAIGDGLTMAMKT
jgi:caffeoyl-CoA O-methyltransferase